MKQVTPAMDAHLRRAATELATCWLITRTDGVQYGYTSHDQPMLVGAVTYKPRSGFTASAVDTKEGLAVDNSELQAIVLTAEFNESELMARQWDYAVVTIFQVNWQAPNAGTLLLRKGTLGEVEFKAQDTRNSATGSFRVELRGMMQLLSQQIGQVVSALCRTNLGDTRCGVALAAHTFTAAVGSVAVDNRTVTLATTLAQPSGHFKYGQCTVTTGANAGVRMEITHHSAGPPTVLTLFEALPYPLAVGDTVVFSAGCDRLFATCVNKFQNAVNFQGEPHLPGQDKLMQPGR